MNPFIVIGYFTRNTFYESYAQTLVESLNQYDITYHIEGIENLGGWYENVNHKPTFIKKMMKKFPEYNIVYVDCDAKFFAYPKLFENIECNVIAVNRFDKRHHGKKCTGFEILSGTIFLKNTEGAYKLVSRWEEQCKKKPHQWDQKSLEQVLGDNFYNLPEEYCAIHNLMKHMRRPVIVHYQASRKVRKNKGKILRSLLQESLPQVLSKIVCHHKH